MTDLVTAFTGLDWVLVGILGVSTLLSLFRGFVSEVLSLLIWAAAFLVAAIFGPALAPLLEGMIAAPGLRSAAAFVTLFVATLVTGALVNQVFASLVRATGLSGTDRLLGMAFGLLRGFVVAVVLLVSVRPFMQTYAWWQQSVLAPELLHFEQGVLQAVHALVAAVQRLF